jgi:hypothetical protein
VAVKNKLISRCQYPFILIDFKGKRYIYIYFLLRSVAAWHLIWFLSFFLNSWLCRPSWRIQNRVRNGSCQCYHLGSSWSFLVEIFGPLLIFNYNVSKWSSLVYIAIFEDIIELIILSQRKFSFFEQILEHFSSVLPWISATTLVEISVTVLEKKIKIKIWIGLVFLYV